MKLSIAVLSSILAVCSVTTAGPVYPSSATNAGASTSAGGSDSPEFPTEDGLMKYCSPFGTTQVSLIEEIAKTRARIEKMVDRFEGIRHNTSIQRKVVLETVQKFESLKQTPGQLLDNAEAEYNLHQKKLEKLEEDLEDRVRIAWSRIHQEKELKKTLIHNLATRTLMASDSLLGTVPGYTQCFHYFFNHFIEELS
ncbi:hypothetical protein BATDEDRAFT_92381 [Batrachochytrium dendrobatidis JAM81]|uniref:Uncharacterized protein n=1 Tax=Batrachochytrium dendrobatidis (strain JAM81 / FGSC 10211) TaxID=684364 RepID=F4PDQ3_BATDJ|nr:uncharacterized protein BATDEDRAFT_92381 [Batrachochytrium dendrobatidis JAM81]XP_006683452.1 uncharacterized protein BATDEDRAFT_28960 [Batrachochytrium dendrobatidis JAM81]EGF75923.1 hypothetical protein BATDEDRAFT_28960 [Batrachochytrium dendrobatidis JAM81]EGF76823.1 hypothetical protein BATDEDRAFT_92381 [Batrachochytrium dendrobatidis JAM81]|eukprot:XP_006682743.1 hypothetical protein BATDEDRAFT_92381 [Batrachochytrium dendrobatidis JAM81]